MRVEMIAVGDIFEPDPSSRSVAGFTLARGSKTIESTTG
jgi:hypothetical protein